MDRRSALRAAAAAAGLAATGCGTHEKSRPAVVAPSAPGTAPESAPPGSSAPSRVALPAEVVRGPADRPNVALTFHGQGDPALVRQLLAELSRGGARVTVLAVGSWLAQQPDMAKAVLDGGHELGNHTQNHLDIAAMSPAQAFAEIDTCARELTKLTG